MKSMWKYILGLFASILLLTVSGYGMRINVSSSLAETLFISYSAQEPLSRGDIVLFDHPKLDATLGKIIIGCAGDQISIQDKMIWVNGVEIGAYKTVSSSGKSYHPINVERIPEGHYFVYATNPESFDSRYEEFGLIKSSWIREVLWPLF